MGIDFDRLTVRQTAMLLKKSGSEQASDKTVRALISSGAPANPDGTISLPRFVAWLVSQYA